MASELLPAPIELLKPHRARLAGLRLEGGYGPEQYEELIGATVYRLAEYVHCLPATRAENHCEEGGLLRLAIETGCMAFRRADGKFLAGPAATDIEDRERDRVWRYAVLIGGLLRPLGRCVTRVRVTSCPRGLVWNALHEPLWSWLQRVDHSHLEIRWQDRTDAHPVRAAAVWVGSRILGCDQLGYLQSGGEALAERLLEVIAGEREGRLAEIVEHAYQAALDQDFNHRGAAVDAPVTGLSFEHRLLEALRALVREKWTANAAGSRLWFTREGVFILWKPAVSDLLVRLRTEAVPHGPRDPDTIAEILLAHGVLTANPHASGALRHYYRLVPQLRGVPRQGLEVVKVADAELLGLRTESLERIEAELVISLSSTKGAMELQADVAIGEAVQLPLAVSRTQEPVAELPGDNVDAVASSVDPRSARGLETDRDPRLNELERLKRFGEAGTILQALGQRLLADPNALAVVRVAEGVAIAFPQAIEAIGARPQAFLSACEAQGLLVPERAGSRQVVRRRAVSEAHLPEQFVVLTARVARYLPLES